MKTCETCNKNPGVTVVCAGNLPISVSFCQACLDRGAEPYWILRMEIMCCGGFDRMLDAGAFKSITTFYEGEYCTLGEALSKDPYTLDNQIEDLNKSYDEYVEKS